MTLLVLLLGCGGGGGDTGVAPIPAVEGRYNVQPRQAVGCEGDYHYVQDWVSGPLTVTEDGNGLGFDFGDSMVFGGSIDSEGAYHFAGQVDYDGAALSISSLGDFSQESEQWVMRGEVSAEVDDDESASNNCTIDLGFEAYEITALE